MNFFPQLFASEATPFKQHEFSLWVAELFGNLTEIFCAKGLNS
jgi:hypothetical protein